MTTTDVTTPSTDAERFGHLLQVQRAAYLRDGAPSLAARRSDLARFKADFESLPVSDKTRERVLRRNALEFLGL